MPKKMRFSLTPDQASFVKTCVDSGCYSSASEVVRAGLRLLADREEQRLIELTEVRRLVQEGAASIDRGELHDAGRVFASIRGVPYRSWDDNEST